MVGDKMATRVAASLLRATDVPELVIRVLSEYVGMHKRHACTSGDYLVL
jgi:predicted O-linked N-acetylglucosamine transferase (SPINDLY family)